ncbi:MAG TPA: DsbA family protein [Longimicrobiaceae bacterium]|nr:DsbA family protein [Longimicrobiaceae bacterium]
MQVETFTDFTCPFSYVTEAALRRAAAETGAAVRYRAFELYSVPAPLPLDAGMEWAEALAPLAAETGVVLSRPGYQSRTRKAHEAARFAEERGAGDAMRAAIFAAYFAEGRDVGRIDVLVEIGTALGLDRTELKVVLDIDRYTGAVLADEALAERSGIRSVPVVVAGSGTGAQALVGAQSYAALREAVAAR